MKAICVEYLVLLPSCDRLGRLHGHLLHKESIMAEGFAVSAYGTELAGLAADRPTNAPAGITYFATDTSTLFVSAGQGDNWSGGIAAGTYVQLLVTDIDGTVKGQLWYDDSENKLKFKTAVGVETVTST